MKCDYQRAAMVICDLLLRPLRIRFADSLSAFLKCLLLAMHCLHSSYVCAAERRSCDVLVYGGTPAGIMAAISASENGQRTILIEPHQRLGGVMSSGLCATDMNSHSRIGGRAKSFFQRVYAHYQLPEAWRCETREQYFERSIHRVFTGKHDPSRMQWVFEPHVAEHIFEKLLDEAGVTVVHKQRLDRQQTIDMHQQRLQSIRTEEGQIYAAKMFIDATYEGDLMALSQVSYIVGREANNAYDEQFNGVRGRRYGDTYAASTGPIHVDPFISPGQPQSGLLPFIAVGPRGANGDADHGVQTYCFRYTLTDDPGNRRAIEKPENYNPLWFEVLGRTIAANPQLTLRSLMSMAPLPNRKVDVNMSNLPGANYEWPDGDYALRSQVSQRHRDFALGKLYFLVTDARVPQVVREELSKYGLPLDEFEDNGNFPTQLYVREARRMTSDYVMTEHNVLRTGTRQAEDGIAIGSYMVDSHQVGYYVDEQGELYVDGALGEKPRAYAISYRSIIPSKGQCQNLLVPVCLSSTHSAYGSIRMEPVFMVIGHSAGTAAALAIQRESSLQDLPYSVLKSRLKEEGQVFLEVPTN